MLAAMLSLIGIALIIELEFATPRLIVAVVGVYTVTGISLAIPNALVDL